MNIIEVTVSDDLNVTDSEISIIKKAANKVLEIENIFKDVFISVFIVSKEEIKTINNEQRGINKETDVLSFPSLEFDEKYKPVYPITESDLNPENNALYLGDMVICYDVVKNQALEYGHSIERELSYLTVHSMYHLLGYDHINSSLKAVMREKEENALLRDKL